MSQIRLTPKQRVLLVMASRHIGEFMTVTRPNQLRTAKSLAKKGLGISCDPESGLAWFRLSAAGHALAREIAPDGSFPREHGDPP